MDNSEQFEGVAIIGMAGRFPGAADISEFWQNVATGTESISFFSDEQLLSAGVDPSLFARSDYVRASGVLADADLFDAGLFGFNPREAELLDPQHRVFLETAWHALEDAAYDSERYEGAIGVYAGVSLNSYFLHNVAGNREVMGQVGGFQALLGSDKDFLPTRVSYKLNLRGPSVTVQTACSTSLVAVHIACQALLGGECDMALAGGVSVSVPQESGYVYQEGGIASPDGHCRAFDAAAKGTVGGNGVAVVVLKRLSEAVADGDRIYAVIKGTAINNDGSDKIGYTAPSTNGQAEVIAQGLAIANVKPETVTYIEAHGTGTELGDPIEVAALTEVFRASTEEKQFCAIGSVKTNVGHLDTAAGVAGLIKTALALQHRQLPPSLHFEQPNPRIDFAQSPFYVNTELRPWTRNGTPRRAGVSSFGIGGTNAHAVLEEAPARVESTEPVREWQLLVLSGRSEAVLEEMSEQLAQHLLAHPEQQLADVAYTLQSGRRVMTHKRAVLCRSGAEAAAALQARDGRVVLNGVQEQKGRPVVLMFPGQGTQYVGMGAELYEREAVYRREFDRCDEVLRGQLGFSLVQLLYGGGSESASLEQELQQTRVTQPALFAVEYALARQLQHWGVKVEGMIGHSVGEYVAACLAGVFTLEEGLRLVALRGRLMQGMKPGVMLSVGLGEAAVQQWLRPGVSLAAVNSAQLSVVSGAAEAVAELETELTAAGVWSRRLRTSHAFHSESMEPAAQQLVKAVEQVQLRAPQQRFISNVSGEWIKTEEALSAEYWGQQLREPVRFWNGLQEVLKEGGKLLVEVGPGRGLSVLAREAAQGVAESAVVRTMRSAEETGEAQEWLQRGVGQVWVQGGQLSWEQLREGEVRRREQVPGYAFERERFWIERPQTQPDEEQERGKIVKKTDIADWFYVPSWKRSRLLKGSGSNNEERVWLMFKDESGLGGLLSEQLLEQQQRVLTVSIGERFARADETTFTLDPREPEHYRQLFSLLQAENQLPHKLLHLWSLSEAAAQSFEAAQSHGLYSLLYLTQALAEVGLDQDVELEVVTTETQEVNGVEQLQAAKATVLGACKVIPQEHSRLQCRVIDVELNGAQELSRVAEQLLTEVSERIEARVVAYRGTHRWQQSYERVRVSEGGSGRRLRRGGVYLITGGFGGVGQALAGYLAAEVGAKLVLVNRSGAEGASRAEAVRRLEEQGAEVLALRADVSDEQEMRAAVEQTLARFGQLNGVIHAAGIAGLRAMTPVQDTDLATCDMHFLPKVRGLLVLEEVLKDQELDFAIVTSSLSSVLGGLGFFAYASSNLFIDTYVHQHERISSIQWTSVNWDGWNFSGEEYSATGHSAAELSMTPAEGAEVFSRILSLEASPQVIVSTGNLNARLAQWVNRAEADVASKSKSAAPRHSRPNLKTTFSAPRNDLEATILRVWQELLGIDQIGIHDNFFELGGHSLLATQVISHLRTALRVEVPVRSIFEKPSVAELAASIEEFIAGETHEPSDQTEVEPVVKPDDVPVQAPVFAITRAVPVITRRNDTAPAPLSFAQQRLWFLQQFEPGSTAYNYPKAVRFTGELNLDVLRQSLEEVVRRHEMLRTTFRVADGGPVQVISPFTSLPFPLINFEEYPEDERENLVTQFIKDESQRPFDLAEGPLVRFNLLRLNKGEHVLLLTMHHITTDAWSLGVLINEVAHLYEAYSSGKPSTLPELPLQYADYALWQREWLQGELYGRQLEYWREQLAGIPPVLELPTDRPRPPLQTTNGAYYWFEIDKEIAVSLKSLSQSEGATLFMVLLAAFKVLLSRYTGQQDIVVGTPIANRNQEEIEGLIGFFVNTLVLRTDLSGGPSFREAIKREREVCLGAYAHQDLPFEKLVEELQPQRDLSHTPLFQVMFLLENASLINSDSEARSLTFTPVDISYKSSKFDLTLGFTEVGHGLAGAFEYNTDLFDAETIAELAARLTTLLRAAVAHPETAVSQLPLLTTGERRRLLRVGSETQCEYPAPLVHELFEQQVVLAGAQPALEYEGVSLSYEELNRRANQLAHYLRACGVGAETVVGLCQERSLELVISILATLKAGGAYLPLEPTYPGERLRYMVANAGCEVVLTSSALAEAAELGSELAIIKLDQEAAAIAAQSTANPVSEVSAENSAYVIYTSGSTGQPKGVVNTHGGLRNRLQWMQQQYELTRADAVLQKTPFSFDVSVWEFLWPFLAGARLVVARPGGHQDSSYLVELIREREVTVMHFVPSMLRVFLQDAGARRCTSLRLVVCSGEALGAELVAEFNGQLGARLENLYGPTEAAIDVSYWACPRGAELRVVPIGKPIANTELYVLDEQLEPRPVGVSGEIYIGGAGLARGYVGQAGLTGERFIPHPFAEGERLYRTGDVGRWNREGELEYLGRGDTQVKVRGFRIELEEIEAAVGRTEGVAECVVELREARAGDQRLVCYVVMKAGAQLQVSELREQLRESLPEYMVPGVYVELEQLPLSAHGKLDRKRLPEPGGERPELEMEYEEPRGELEREIAAVWTEVLGVERVGAYDNFFDLGGHSLLVVEAQRKLAERGVGEVSVVEMFQYPTVSALAKRMTNGKNLEKQRAKFQQHRIVDRNDSVAIIGMAGRFPGAANVSEFWQNLATGTESISFFSDEQLLSTGVDASLLARPEFVRAAGVLPDADLFDAGLFGVSPREAELLDPQHRVFLETAWHALEDAAYDSERYEGAIGVYAGVSLNSYFLHNVSGNREVLGQVGGFQALLSSDKDFLPTRVSYKLNLRGPSVTVQTACSTSLVAVHIACQALLGGECDMALAGGVSVSVPQERGYVYQEGGIASPDGHCRAFDAAAKGTVSGNGVGVVALKRLSEAVADGDRIYAVIKGTAINNDGSDKIGYTAPSVDGQSQAIARAQAIAGFDPHTIGYVEAHGTGTELGDPIEVAALTEVFRASTEEKQFCALGSVKTNVGHLDAAAGVAGLIKTALALQHRQLPPSLHFEQPNPRIDFAQSPFYVNTELRTWTRNGTPRRAGVSSFGIGGTNAHAVLEEAPARVESTEPVREWQLLVLSGRSEAVLEEMSEQLAQHLLAHPEQQLADVAYTLQSGRRVMTHKRAVLCRSGAEAAAALQARDGRVVLSGVQEQKGRPVVLMFPGQGAQYVGMGAELYEREAVYRREFDRCDEVLRGQLGFSLVQLLYGGGSESASLEQELQQTRVTQPALFAVEYALARQLLHWGVKVEGMIGHSVGEYVAACLAGVFTLEEGLRLVALRGRLMQGMKPGVMLSVGLGEAAVQQWLRPGVSLAAVNSAQLSVVSGTAEAVGELEAELTAAGVWSRRLRTSHAFHSESMEPAAQQLVQAVEQVQLRAPQQRFISNVSGEWIKREEALSAAYWGRQLREPVRFWNGLQEVLKEGGKLLVEVGPGRGLSVLAREAAQGVAESAVVRTMRSAEEAGEAQEWLQRGVGQLWVQGGQVSWEQLREGEVRRREQVPGYAFERERFWIEPTQTQPDAGKVIREPDIADWFYVPSWKQAPLGMDFNADALTENPKSWLIFKDESGLGELLSGQLLGQQQRVFTVSIGERFARTDETTFTLDPQQPEHYRQLFSLLQAENQLPHKLLHLWSLSEAAPQSFEAAQSRGLYSLLYLTQALVEVGLDQDVEVEVVTTETQEVSGVEQLQAAKATVLGACKVIPQEHSRLQCRVIDVELNGAQELSRVAEQLLLEVSEGIEARVVAYRGTHRWEQSYERVRVNEGGAGRRLRRGGVYLITGGFGGVGQALAGYLAAEVGAKLVLVSRSGAEEASRAEALRRLEEQGAEVLPLQADVSDEQEMRAAVEQTLAQFGQLNGVIHAAGIAGGAIIERVDSQILQTAFEAKIKGTLVLDHLLKDVDLDFLLLCSSHRSILGGLGRVDYAAANAFLDVYARAEQRSKNRYVVSINWDTWRDVGMAVDVARQHSLDPAEAIQEGVYAWEGVEAFRRILNTNLPQVIVSPEDFQTRVKESESLSTAKMLEELEKQSASQTSTEVKLHVRPELSTQYVEPRNEVERTLSGIWEKILGIAPIGVQDNYLELGGDSVLSIQIVARANQAGLKLAPRHMFEHQTIEALAAVAGTTAKLKAEQGVVSGVAPLTPIQHWFFEQELADAHHYNQAVMLEMRSSISIDGLREVVGKILLHHDALRMRFKRKGSYWQQENAKYEGADVLQLIDVSEMPEAQQRAEIEAHAQQVQKQLDLEHGPLMRVVVYKSGKERRLLVVVHHLIIDAVSWRILLEDLQRGCEQFTRGGAIDFGAKTTSYKEWGESLEKLARNGAVDDEMPYWAAAARSDAGRMPLDGMDGSNEAGSVDVVRVSLEEEETTSLLQQVGKAYNTSVEEALLTALREAYEQWTGQDRLLVDVEGHGREEIEDGVDVTRTVGWFTSIYPVLLENQEDANIGKKLAAVKETMRQVKRSGLGYGMLRYLGSETEKLKQLPEAEIIFLYLGQLDRVIGDEGDLSVASESAGESRSARGKRKHLLEISSAVTGGKLELSWNYSKNLHNRETIEKLAGDHVEFLRELIMHCQSPDAKGYTPSDFPEVSLTQAELDALLARLG